MSRGSPSASTSCAARTTSLSTQPPETEPASSPLSLTTSFEPTGLGAELRVATTVATATLRPSSRQRPACVSTLSIAPQSSARSAAEVGLAEVLVLSQLGGRPFEHHPAGREHVATVGDREGDVRVLLHDENRHPRLVYLLDDLEVPLDENRSQSHGRLVHEQQLRLGHESSSHGHHLLLAAGERPGELGAALVQKREEVVDAVVGFVRAAALQVGAHLEVLAHGHRREEPPVLGHDRDPLPDPVARRPRRHILAREAHAAVSRPHDAEHRLQGRRLARRVAPEQADELARRHLEVHALEDVDRPVVRVDGLEPQEGLGRRPVPARLGHFLAAALVPRYASTTRGSVATSSKVPSAILTPWSSATTRSEMPSTTCMSCSITRIV